MASFHLLETKVSMKLKKQLLAIAILQLLSFGVLAQQTVSGKIVSEVSKEGLPFANVVLEDSLAGNSFGQVSELNGTFKFKKVPSGTYTLKASVIGYETISVQGIEIGQSALKLSNIQMKASSLELDEVQVVAERSYIENKAGKRIINVGSDLVNSGGSALEVLTMAPGVEVGIAGEVSIRGGNEVFVLINGKETALSFLGASQALKRIPAKNIEKIEVITNAGAEFGPDGEVGMINIILKKNRSNGLEYTFGLNGDMMPVSSSASAGVEYKKDKLGLSFNYNIDKERDRFKDESTRTYTQAIAGVKSLESRSEDQSESEFHFLMGGASYQINDSTEVSLSLFYEKGNNESNTTQTYTSRLTDNTSRTNQNKITSPDKDTFKGVELSYSQRFSNEKELEISGQYSDGYTEANNTNLSDEVSQNNRSFNKSTFSNGNLSVKFETPVLEYLTIKTGLDSDLLKFKVNQNVTQQNQTNNTGYTFEQTKHALYVISNWSLGFLELGLGARIESYQSKGQQIGGENFKQELFNVFPNLQFTTGLGGDTFEHSLMFSYSKRINRPQYEELNPTTDFSDPLNISRGNPDLIPEFAHVFELTHELSGERLSFYTTFFHRVTTNVIQTKRIPQANNVILSTYLNESNRQNSGLELYLTYDLAGWWDISNNFTIFNKKFNGNSQQVGFTNTINWNNKIVSNFKPGNGFRIQLQMRYLGKQNGLFFAQNPYYTVGLGLSKDVIKGKGKLNLGVTDIFNGIQRNSDFVQDGFVTKSVLKYNTRRINLGFTLTLN